jgi:hypothetical protein
VIQKSRAALHVLRSRRSGSHIQFETVIKKIKNKKINLQSFPDSLVSLGKWINHHVTLWALALSWLQYPAERAQHGVATPHLKSQIELKLSSKLKNP